MADITETIRAYIREVAVLPNEAGRIHRFTLLLGRLFGDKVAFDVIKGIEKFIRVYRKDKPGRGFIDSYYGNAVIEFESNLDTKIEEAELQLREYASGIWEEEGRVNPLIGIASDGIK